MLPAPDAIDLLVLGAVWGASYLFMRVAAPEFGPVVLIFLRVVIAAVLLGAVLVRRGGLHPLREAAVPLTVVGAINTAIPFTLFAYASLSLPAGLNAVLNATVPLFGALVALVWLGQRLSATRLLGLAVGFAGVLALAWPTLTHGSNTRALTAALVATVLYAVSAHYARERLAHLPALVVAGGSQIAAALLLAPLAFTRWPVVAPTRTAWLAAASLGVVCTAFAYGLYFRLLARSGPMTAMAVTYLIPVFGVAWGALFLGERLPSSALAGGSLVLAGVALATRVPTARVTAR